jgi:hypothetical protein
LETVPVWWENPVTLATIVIAFAAVISLFVSIGMWVATWRSVDIVRKTYEATHRPYLGVQRIDSEEISGSRGMKITLQYKNFGPVPATVLDLSLIAYVDGTEVARGPAKKGITQHPGAPLSQRLYVRDPEFAQVENGRPLEITLGIKYRGPVEKTYSFSQRYLYLPALNLFSPQEGFAD